MMENPGICPPIYRGNLAIEFYTQSPKSIFTAKIHEECPEIEMNQNSTFRHMLKSIDVQ